MEDEQSGVANHKWQKATNVCILVILVRETDALADCAPERQTVHQQSSQFSRLLERRLTGHSTKILVRNR